MARVFLGLGSNLGDRRTNLCRALACLPPHVTVVAVSSLYDSTPMGVLAQPRFLNAVCEGETALPPKDLLRFVKDIEATMGRAPTVRHGPRNIDIDILLARPFVLRPLAELAPTLSLPCHAETFGELAAAAPKDGLVVVQGSEWALPDD